MFRASFLFFFFFCQRASVLNAFIMQLRINKRQTLIIMPFLGRKKTLIKWHIFTRQHCSFMYFVGIIIVQKIKRAQCLPTFSYSSLVHMWWGRSFFGVNTFALAHMTWSTRHVRARFISNRFQSIPISLRFLPPYSSVHRSNFPLPNIFVYLPICLKLTTKW